VLGIPVGMGRSVEEHNIDFTALCDWIEGCVLFDGDTLSVSQVVRALTDNDVYEDPDLANQIVTSAWSEIEKRQAQLCVGASMEVAGQRIAPHTTWQDSPGHSFCLMLACAKWYPPSMRQTQREYNEQGELFERLTAEALPLLFRGWKVYATGWTRTRVSKINEVVGKIAGLLNESPGQVRRWVRKEAHEAGLDIICYRPFDDGRVGWPVFLVQCASGQNWPNKVHTPDLHLWGKLVDFAATPRKAFAMPFALVEDEFRYHCVVVDGLLLDRYRLLAASCEKVDWVSPQLKADIITWVTPRLKNLPHL